MRPIVKTILLLVAVLVVAGTIFRQETEIRRLRTAIAESGGDRSYGVEDVSANSNLFSADIKASRPEIAEVQRLRSEVAQLRLEKAELSALQASVDKLTREVSAISGTLKSYSLSGFDRPSSNDSSIVSRAAFMAQSSPEKAAEWVATLPAGDDQNQAVLAVIDRWVGSDPVAAAAWASRFAEGTLRDRAMSLVARQWGLRDCSAASTWLETLPAGSSRDTAIGAFVTSADGYDIKLALEWANRIEDPANRALRVEETARRWLRENNAAARAWIEKAQLPEGLSARLLSAK